MKLKEIKKKAAEKLEKAKEFVKENKELVYDREVEVSIDGIKHKCLYQYLGKEGAALWLDGGQEESYKELDKHFRED